jgi:hypothetical protein
VWQRGIPLGVQLRQLMHCADPAQRFDVFYVGLVTELLCYFVCAVR